MKTFAHSYFGALKSIELDETTVAQILAMPKGAVVSLTTAYEMYLHDLGILFFDDPDLPKFSDMLTSGIVAYAKKHGLQIRIDLDSLI